MLKVKQKIIKGTAFQESVSNALGLKLVTLQSCHSGLYNSIVFTENYTRILRSDNKVNGRGSLEHGSLTRRLLNSAIFKLSGIISKDGLIIDVGGGGDREPFNYARLLRIKNENMRYLNISGASEINYNESAEENCPTVPKGKFDVALCLGFLLLAKDPYKVVGNISSFLKKGGIAILDFASLQYWYCGKDGRHWNSYNPGTISDIISDNFSESVIVPVGNFFMAALAFYAKFHKNRVMRYLLRSAAWLGKFDRSPISSTQYLVIAKK